MVEKTHTHIEDALSDGAAITDPETILDDEELRQGGLVPVRTWARTRTSTNALRAKRSREKAEKGDDGSARKQVSLLAPPDDEARAALRDLGKRMIEGDLSIEDIRSVGRSVDQANGDEVRIGRRALALIKGGGVRGRLLKYLLGHPS